LQNSLTTIFPRNLQGCLHFTLITASTPASSHSSRSQQSMQPQLLRILQPTSMKPMNVLLKMSLTLKITKPSITTPSTNLLNSIPVIWFGSTLQTSQPPDPPRSSIGNASALSRLRSALDYKPTSWTCPLQCVTSTIHFTSLFWTPLKQLRLIPVTLQHLQRFTLKTITNISKLRISLTQNAKVVASTTSSNGKVTQILRILGNPPLVSPPVVSLKNFIGETLVNQKNPGMFTLLDYWLDVVFSCCFGFLFRI